MWGRRFRRKKIKTRNNAGLATDAVAAAPSLRPSGLLYSLEGCQVVQVLGDLFDYLFVSFPSVFPDHLLHDSGSAGLF